MIHAPTDAMVITVPFEGSPAKAIVGMTARVTVRQKKREDICSRKRRWEFYVIQDQAEHRGGNLTAAREKVRFPVN